MAFKSSQNIANDYKKNDDTGFELKVINIEKTDSKEFNNTNFSNTIDSNNTNNEFGEIISESTILQSSYTVGTNVNIF